MHYLLKLLFKKQNLAIVTLLLTTTLYAQKEGAIWYFGNHAGFNFITGSPVALNDSALYTGEGCATIADANGDLLFYTNGVVVYNKNHELMPNGSNLDGWTSSSQSAIIIKKPQSDTIYYIFTTVSADGGYYDNGLNFYEVDLSLENGLGDVTQENNNPIGTNTTPLATPIAEKLTATYHADGESIWVLAHKADNSQDFIAYLVTANGVNTTPVVSTIGAVNNRYQNNTMPFYTESNLYGCMKFSPDGSKVATALGYSSGGYMGNGPEQTLTMGVELLDFDNATGILSNNITINTLKSYGVEFSPNSNVLYTSSTLSVNPDRLLQYDITGNNQTDIQNSETLITQGTGIHTLQLGIDGKLYGAKSLGGTSLHVVNNPNALGTNCDFNAASVYMNGGLSYNGLPNFLTSYFEEKINYTAICSNDMVDFTVSPYVNNIQSASWNFDDPDSGAENTSTLITPSHLFSQGGTYNVTATIVTNSNQNITITTTVTIGQSMTAATPEDLETCDTEDNNGFATFDLNTQTNTILNNQTGTVTYYTTAEDANNGTNLIDTSALYTNTIANLQTIYARLDSNPVSECFDVVTFDLLVHPTPVLTFNTNYEVCSNTITPTIITTTQTNTNITNPAYSWYNNGILIDNATSNTLEVYSAGNYTVTVATAWCSYTYEITVDESRDCIIPQGISPGTGDNSNENFDLSGFNISHISVFNRLGAEVYSKSNYTNQWHGQTNKGHNVPVGTYYYILTQENGNKITGWVYVNRKN